MAERLPLPERKQIKDALRESGLTDRQVRTLLASGWAALVGEEKAELDQMRDELDLIRASFAIARKHE